jgi:nucleotide-binding universal stress UspA family protein
MQDTSVLPSLAQESNRSTKANLPREVAYPANRDAVQIRGKKVMLVYDSSSFAETALEVARTMAQELSAKLLIICVVPLPTNSNIADLETSVDQARQRFSKKFYRIRLDGMNEGLRIETMLALGDAGELSRRNAERFQIHLIVVGSPGVSAILRSVTRTQEVRLDSSSRTLPNREQDGLCGPARTSQEIA